MTRLGVLVFVIAVAAQSQAATRGRGEIGSRPRNRISSTRDTTCVVTDGGGVRCWGRNDFGAVGNGTSGARVTTPVAATSVTLTIAIASGGQHTCALASDGRVKCWGLNVSGQLGNGTTTSSTTAVQVNDLDDVQAIAAGDSHTCALRANGEVNCWGSNVNGTLGIGGGPQNSSTPLRVPGVSNAVAIAAGGLHNCALQGNGTLRCWGRNASGQVGDGSTTDRPFALPVPGLAGVVAIAAGARHTCALVVSGGARCWGDNASGQLGDGSTSGRSAPVAVSQLDQAISIDGGGNHTCAVRANGGVRCWGTNSAGQLGDGTTTQRLDAAAAVAGLNNAVEIAAGDRHTCAMDAIGTARCWGANPDGQLGTGTVSSSSTPATAIGITGTVGARGIVNGTEFTCALRGIGTVGCWGRDREGQLGNGGSFANSSNPVTVDGLTDAVVVAGGHRHACALRAGGTVVCWGSNNSGQLGAGGTTNRSTPLAVPGLSGVVSVSAGADHTCALLHDGTVRCWGANRNGQLGNDSFAESSLTPVAVSGLSDATAIVAASQGPSTCALVADGTARCWGQNDFGQLGNGSTSSSQRAPVVVTGLSNAVALTMGRRHTCVLVADGGARCWGVNSTGELGNSTTQDRSAPDVVSGLSDAVAISAGARYTCAVRVRGSAVCWGQNVNGQLGAADSLDHSTPTPVIDQFATVQGTTIPIQLQRLTSITTAPGELIVVHTCALQSTGLPKCWGNNVSGQIGDGTTTDRARPTLVPSFTANVAPEATLQPSGRLVQVTGLLNCDPGSQGLIFIYLTQNGIAPYPGPVFGYLSPITGFSVANATCGDDFLEVPLTVLVGGPEGFHPGDATARLEAVIWDNSGVTQHQLWTRDVLLGERGGN